MAFEIAEAMNTSAKLHTWANKVQYRGELSAEEKEFSELADAWAKELGRTGCDPDHELAAIVERALTPDEISAPSELISRMFEEGNIDEFDDEIVVANPKNTIQVHEAISGGNVDRSFLEHKIYKPTWRTLQAETDLSYTSLRRGGYHSVAEMVTKIQEAFEFRKVQMILEALDKEIVDNQPNYITEASTAPTAASADALALYLMDMADTEKPLAFMSNKYRQDLNKLAQAERWPTPEQRSMYNTDGMMMYYAGMELLGFSGTKKTPDGKFVIPANRIFGVADKIGRVTTRGSVRVLQEEDINNERTHVKVTGLTFGWVFTDIENAAKIVLASSTST